MFFLPAMRMPTGDDLTMWTTLLYSVASELSAAEPFNVRLVSHDAHGWHDGSGMVTIGQYADLEVAVTIAAPLGMAYRTKTGCLRADSQLSSWALPCFTTRRSICLYW